MLSPRRSCIHCPPAVGHCTALHSQTLPHSVRAFAALPGSVPSLDLCFLNPPVDSHRMALHSQRVAPLGAGMCSIARIDAYDLPGPMSCLLVATILAMDTQQPPRCEHSQQCQNRCLTTILANDNIQLLMRCEFKLVPSSEGALNPNHYGEEHSIRTIIRRCPQSAPSSEGALNPRHHHALKVHHPHTIILTH